MATQDNRTGWAIVGLGNVVVNRFAPALVKSPNSALVACATRDVEKARAFAARFGNPRVHATFDALLQDAEVQALYIASPNSLHYQQARDALLAGKHVLCEKPLAHEATQGRVLARLADERKVCLHVAYQFRFESVVERMRELVRAGAIGEPRAVVLTGASPATITGAWRSDPAEGGILSDLGVHLLDLVSWLAGARFTDVAARANPPDMRREPVRTISVLGTLQGNCHAYVRASRELGQVQQALTIEGSKGTLSASAWRNASEYTLTIVDGAGTRSEQHAAVPIFEREIAAFEDELAGKPSTLATAADGVHAIEVASAVWRSAASGTIVGV